MTSFANKKIIVAFSLFCLTLIVYLPAVSYDFLNFDDNLYVTENSRVQEGLTWRNVLWAITALEAGFWHPLTWLSHMLDCELFGMNAGGHHLTNVLLHGASVLVLFVVLYEMTGGLWRSALVAALFALHPLNVESVTWVAERKNVLSALMWLLTMWAYVRYAREKKAWRYVLVFVLLALGLAAKPMLVTLPFVLLLLDYWPLGRFEEIEQTGAARGGSMSRPSSQRADATAAIQQSRDRQGAAGFGSTSHRSLKSCETWVRLTAPFRSRLCKLLKNRAATGRERDQETTSSHSLTLAALFRLLREKLPLLVPVAIVSVLTIQAEDKIGALSDDLSLAQRLGNATLSYGLYLKKLFWPVDLAVFYPHPIDQLSSWTVAGAGLLLLGLTAAAVLAGRKHGYVVVGWLWYLGTLVPVSGVVQVGGHAMADRYAYIPLIGLFIALVWGTGEILRSRRPLAWAGAGVVLALLLISTRVQLAYWRSTTDLFEQALSVSPQNHVAFLVLGRELKSRGEVERAIEYYQEAIRIRPRYTRAYVNLGLAHLEQGELDLAAKYFVQALEIRPELTEARNNLGFVYWRKGNLEEARNQFSKAIELDPGFYDAYNNLGVALMASERLSEAIEQFSSAIQINPVQAEAYVNLGLALAKSGREEEASRWLNKAIEVQPEYAESYYYLALVRESQGRLGEAIDNYRETLERSPDHPSARKKLEALLNSG